MNIEQNPKSGKMSINIQGLKFTELFTKLGASPCSDFSTLNQIAQQSDVQVYPFSSLPNLLQENPELAFIDGGFMGDKLILYQEFFVVFGIKPILAYYSKVAPIKANAIEGQFFNVQFTGAEKRALKDIFKASITSFKDASSKETEAAKESLIVKRDEEKSNERLDRSIDFYRRGLILVLTQYIETKGLRQEIISRLENEIEIKGIPLTEEAILDNIIKKFKGSGLKCEKTKIKEGEARTVGGVLLASGGYGIGGGRSKIEKEVWNPFQARLDEMDWWEAIIKITTKSRYTENINQKTYDCVDILIDSDIKIGNRFSGIGCLTSLILGICILNYNDLGWELSVSGKIGVLITILLFIIIYYIVKGLLYIREKSKKEKRQKLEEKIINNLNDLKIELVKLS